MKKLLTVDGKEPNTQNTRNDAICVTKNNPHLPHLLHPIWVSWVRRVRAKNFISYTYKILGFKNGFPRCHQDKADYKNSDAQQQNSNGQNFPNQHQNSAAEHQYCKTAPLKERSRYHNLKE